MLEEQGWDLSVLKVVDKLMKDKSKVVREKEGSLYTLKDEETHITHMEWHERYCHLPHQDIYIYT